MYRLKPDSSMVLTWETIQKLNVNCPPTYNLGRSPKVQEIYDKHRDWLKDSKTDVKTYICEKFNLENKGIVFVENEFPYNCDQGIKHYLIWINADYIYNLQSLEKFIKEKIGSNGDYVFYKNIPANNSISCVNHYHVFVKIQ